MIRAWFAQPWGLYLLTLLPMLSFAAWLSGRARRKALARLGNVALLSPLLPRPGWRPWLRGVCLSLGLTVLAVGIAGPQWGRDWTQAVAPGRDLVVALDVSRSMLAESPSRLHRARNALIELSHAVQAHGGHRLGLVLFAARARVACPLTHDYDHFREVVGGLDVTTPPPELRPPRDALSGTRIGQGLSLAVNAHDAAFAGHQDILLLSDGDDPAGDEEWKSGAELAREAGIPVHAVGVGDADHAGRIPWQDTFQMFDDRVVQTRLDEAPLREIARLTHGSYTAARASAPPLAELFRERIEPQPLRDDNQDALPLTIPRYPWFFAAALLLLVGEIAFTGRGLTTESQRKPRKKTPREEDKGEEIQDETHSNFSLLSFFCLLSVPSVTLWLAPPTPDRLVRQGNTAFDRGDFAAAVRAFQQAAERTDDPGLAAYNQAAALYQLAVAEADRSRRLALFREAELQYRRCLEDAEGARRAGALYGLGNCLVRQGESRGAAVLREAVGCYEQCLVLGVTPPDAADVRHNLELARLLWLQAKTSPDGKPSPDTPDPPEEPDRPSRERPRGLEPGGNDPAGGAVRPGGERLPANPGDTPIPTDQRPAPGQGTLPPVPDQAELVPLPPEDARAHLDRAVQRVQQERRTHQMRNLPPPPRGVKDW